jgi:hypothetical protein
VAQQQAYAAQQAAPTQQQPPTAEPQHPYHVPAQPQQAADQQAAPNPATDFGWPPAQAPVPHQGQHTDPQLQADAAQAYEQALQQQIAAAAQGQAPAQQTWPSDADPQGFDLGSYMPPAGSEAAPPNLDYTQQAQMLPPLQQAGYAAENHAQQSIDPASALSEYAAHQGGLEPAVMEEPQGFDEFGMDPDDEPPRRRRGLVIMATLIGALGIGGGLAYAYNNFMIGKAPTAKTPIVRAAKVPTKVSPKTPGGKPFRHAQKSFYERLGKQPPKAPTSPPAMKAATAPDAPRRVRTVMVRPDGSLAPPAPRVPVRPAPPAPTKPANAVPVESAMPGVVIQGFPPITAADPATTAKPPAARALRGSVAKPPTPPSLPKVKVATPVPAKTPKVRVIATKPLATPVITPKRIAIATPKTAPATRPKTPVVRAAVPAKPVVRVPPSSGGRAGYVAWVSSQRHRMNALAEFANLQQKHAGIMAGKQPEIRQIDLGEKGIWYRLRIGPPGSKTSADDLCRKLLAGGLKNCWVRSF